MLTRNTDVPDAKITYIAVFVFMDMGFLLLYTCNAALVASQQVKMLSVNQAGSWSGADGGLCWITAVTNNRT